ncbi:hypothetical protein MAR_015675 [Mya arenaria]|uniref:Uncharacterized protein n=1 Tax=Mya arenaria TaxID=6604 RepID=A0ABY7FR61_MYAAR|nr:hypothetical protein MAR_015674 [Mya arenaria]WAR21701.1 hypothetical protein MAR_015675 [Mya arenaria]
MKEIQSLREGWVKDIRRVPHVTLESIKRYMSAFHDIAATVTAGAFEKYTDETLRSYKALRAYDLWESGHISGYMFNGLDNIDHFCAVQCLANPSGDTSVVLNDNGAPVGAACTCIAGLGETCSHIAGQLFGVEDFVARGPRDLPDNEGLTEKLYRWTVPKGPKIDPKPIKDVTGKKFNVTDYEPLLPAVRTVDFDSLTLLHHTLSLQCPNLPWVQAVAPAITQKYKANDGDRRAIPKGPTFLPGVVSDDNPVLVPTRDISVKTENIPITLKDKLKLASTSDLVTYTNKEKNQSSHSKKVLKKGENSATDNLVDMLINGSNFKGNKATRYGNRQEPHAASLYVDKMTTDHVNCCTCGLHICKSFEYLGASPDRIFKCACHGKRLVEIKCPFTFVDKSRKIDSLDFITKDENGILKLKTTGNTYYDQIQGQIGVTGIHKCDLVVFDGTNIVVIKVEFDDPYWQNMADALLDFCIDYVYVKMATKNPLCDIQAGRNNVQSAISERTRRFPCGKCGQILEEIVCNDNEASINCECPCKCGKWFHWKCVNFSTDPELDMEPTWYCPPCVCNCDIVIINLCDYICCVWHYHICTGIPVHNACIIYDRTLLTRNSFRSALQQR